MHLSFKKLVWGFLLFIARLYGQCEAEGSHCEAPNAQPVWFYLRWHRTDFLPVHGFSWECLPGADTVLSSLLSLSHLILTLSHEVGSIALFPLHQQGNRDSERFITFPRSHSQKPAKLGFPSGLSASAPLLNTVPPTSFPRPPPAFSLYLPWCQQRMNGHCWWTSNSGLCFLDLRCLVV